MQGRTRNTRVALLQALMPASVGEIELAATKVFMRDAGLLQDVDEKRFNQRLEQMAGQLAELDAVFSPYLNSRDLDELGHAERAILRIATYELTQTSVPRAVAINEWIEIAKDFGAENSFRFVNGILDQVANAVRHE
ncbi:MAG: transcription antitermination factor NusB [Gammaproteobacteria bacterium]|nr:transcription antitermination factor NusB [Gammaproteobacteria bacterium]